MTHTELIDLDAYWKLYERLISDWHAGDSTWWVQELASLTKLPDPLVAAIACDHLMNLRLWHLEDRARSPSASLAEVGAVKKEIDQTNAARNQAIEDIDKQIGGRLATLHLAEPSFHWHTENPGAAMDRLSIMAIRRYHYLAELDRADIDDAHAADCTCKADAVGAQAQTLRTAIKWMLDDLVNGKAMLVARPGLRMYDDPKLNPEIYGKGERR